MKKLTIALLPLAVIATSFSAHAETSDGKTFGVSAGWLHIMPQGSKQGIDGTVPRLLNPTGVISSPNAGFEIANADTGAILLDYFVNDNVSLELVAGVPPKMEIDGKGAILQELGGKGVSLDALGKVGKVDAYTPVILGKYQFGTINSKFRPFVGAGLMYAHFSNFKLEGGVNQKLTAGVQGTPVGSLVGAVAGNLSITDVKIDDAIAPVATIGADYNITKDWFATASVTYAHLQTDASLNVQGDGAGVALLGGNPIITGKTKIEINPIVTYVGVGYRF